jgi:hypothetical protein
MEPLKSSRYTKIGAIVHDELNGWAKTHSEFTSLVEHAAGVAGFVAVLQQRASGGNQFFGCDEERSGVGETGRVEDWIETREHAVKQSLDQVLHFQLTGMMSRAYGVPPNMTNGLCVSGMASPEGNPDVFASAAFKIMM